MAIEELVPTFSPAAVRDLQAMMQGIVALTGDEPYSRAWQVWNGAVNRYPAAIALCESVDDVRAAVRVARAQDLPLSVRGGGHDWAGRALRHDGLVIDLSPMRQVDIDPDAQVATIAGGARPRRGRRAWACGNDRQLRRGRHGRSHPWWRLWSADAALRSRSR